MKWILWGFWASVAVCLRRPAVFFRIPENSQLTKLSLSESERLSDECGRSMATAINSTFGRKYRWTVAITLFGLNTQSGVIISPLHILTAAHPFVRFDKYNLGPCSWNSYKTFEKISLKQIIIGSDCVHFETYGNNYGSKECESHSFIQREIKAVAVDHGFAAGRCVEGHDWAIIEVDKPIPFNSQIGPICLPKKDTQISPIMTALGWGRPTVTSAPRPLLKEIPLRHDPFCIPTIGDPMPTRADDYLCARAVGDKRICHGDSGAGVQQIGTDGRSVLLGVTSFGSEGCPRYELARFTRIVNYLAEICLLTGVCYTA